MNPTHLVYVLSDPRNNQIRYVGKTEKGLDERVYKHLQAANLRRKSHKNAWLKELLREGLRPEADILEIVVPEDLDRAEKFWIEYFRFVGSDLVNHTDGGVGATGYKHTAESKAKIAAANGRRVWTDQARDRASASHKKWFEKNDHPMRGKKQPEEVRIKVSRGNGGRPFVDQCGRRYQTIGEAVRLLGADASTVSKVLHGKVASHLGLVFKYEEAQC